MQIKNIWQCCYAHDDGWKVVFDNIANETIKKNCEELLNRNCNISSDYLERDPNFNIMGVYCDEYAIYIYKIQYGLKEKENSRARSVSFSHAFVFSWETPNLISNPKLFLALKEENFKSSLDEVRAIQEQPIVLRNDNDLRLLSIFNELNIDMDEYRELIDSVFYRLNSKEEHNPIYIQYNGNLDEMFKILYCIFSGIPHHLRKKISAVSRETNNKSDATFIFSSNALDGYLHVDPGERQNNNVLNAEKLDMIEHLLYVNQAVYLAEAFVHAGQDPEKVMEGYFTDLENCIREIYAGREINETDIGIAYRIIEDIDLDRSIKDFNPVMELINAISRGIIGNDLFDNYVAKLVEYFIEHNMKIPDKAETFLENHVGNSTNQRLLDDYYNYKFYKFQQITIDEQLSRLASLEETEFAGYVNLLMQDNKGRKILDQYYAEQRLKVISWENMLSVLYEIIDVVLDFYHVPQNTAVVLKNEYANDCKETTIKTIILAHREEMDANAVYTEIVKTNDKWPNTTNKIMHGAETLYLSDIQQYADPSAFIKYERVLRKIFILQSDEMKVSFALNKAKTSFWKNMKFSKYSISADYSKLENDSEECKRFCIYRELFKSFGNGKEVDFYKAVFQFYSGRQFDYFSISKDEYRESVKLLCKYVEKNRKLNPGVESKWTEVTTYIGNKNVFGLFVYFIKYSNKYRISKINRSNEE